jgi:phytanoyl-CoA hydroxylase
MLIPVDVRTRLVHIRTRIERDVRHALFGSTPSWKRRANAVPWFDQPDAAARLADEGRDANDRALLTQWLRDGYIIVDNMVDPADIEAMVSTLDGLWDARAAIRGLELLDVREAPEEPPRNLSHAEILGLPPSVRQRMREVSDWRIHGFHYVNAPAWRIYFGRGLRGLASRIFGRRAMPIAAINFMTGSQQALHQDMAVFHIYPHGYLMGAWIACEDIAPESGPLVVYAGSHKSGMFPGFTDYPQTNLRTADPEMARRYQAWVDEQAARFERHEFHARKGQLLLWHGMLIHGGAPVLRRGTSRKSMVIHYTVRRADRAREVRGPFNW